MSKMKKTIPATMTFEYLLIVLQKAISKENWHTAEGAARLIAEECGKRALQS